MQEKICLFLKCPRLLTGLKYQASQMVLGWAKLSMLTSVLPTPMGRPGSNEQVIGRKCQGHWEEETCVPWLVMSKTVPCS